jgi:hypothetical protein
MIEGHIIFNAILYSIVIAYILYINFSAYYQTGTGFLKALVNLFQNWIFRTVYLLIVGFFALDLFPYGGFVLAILLTIAFLNTNMLVYKKDVEESMANKDEKKASLPRWNNSINYNWWFYSSFSIFAWCSTFCTCGPTTDGSTYGPATDGSTYGSATDGSTYGPATDGSTYGSATDGPATDGSAYGPTTDGSTYGPTTDGSAYQYNWSSTNVID